MVFTIAILSAAVVSDTLAQFPTMFPAGTSAACRTIVSTDGGVLVFDTVTFTAADVVELPAASRATAVTVCVPFVKDVVVHEVEYGDEVSSAPRLAPSTLNCTPATPTLSEAVAVSVVEPDTVVPFVGAVMATVGFVVSVGGGGVRRCRP